MSCKLAKRWDIFCSVVDNYGDIGICWRLARQLADEWNLSVVLWVDNLAAFAKICPSVQTALAKQSVHNVEIRRWSSKTFSADSIAVADVVVEAFACGLPQEYLLAMSLRAKTIAYFNLEYLSAESWIDNCHLLDSPHPTLPLKQRFFFPGFSASSGGLLREKNLIAERIIWQNSCEQQNAFWQKYAIPLPQDNEMRVSIFCYPDAALESLFMAWINGSQKVSALLPKSLMTKELSHLFATSYASDLLHQGALTLKLMPFVEQSEYDRILWSCDFNIVRGEDSFVRAQWAARPLIWHIYPQADNAHKIKLEAFFARYLQDVPEICLAEFKCLYQQINGAKTIDAPLVKALFANSDLLKKHAENWCDKLSYQTDLASQLVQAAQSWLQ